MLDEANVLLHPVSDLFRGLINIFNGCSGTSGQKKGGMTYVDAQYLWRELV